MKEFIYSLCIMAILLAVSTLHAQDHLSDCEIHMDELELQLKKEQKDTKKYFHIQLEEGNAIFEKDLKATNSIKDRRELRKEYKDFVRGLEKDYNREMNELEDTYFETLEGLEDSCGYRAVRRRIIAWTETGNPYNRPRSRYR